MRTPIESFRPDQVGLDLEVSDSAWAQATRAEVRAASIEELRALNAHWFREPSGMLRTVAILVWVNREFTARGVGPAWRGLPRDVKTAAGQGSRLSLDGKRILLGDAAKKRLILRWVDLEWLRSELGARHRTRFKSWDVAFSEDEAEAMQAFERVIGLKWSSSEIKAPTRWMLLNRLRVPEPHRRALTGLMDTGAARVVATVKKRLQGRIEPALRELMNDRHQRLTPALLEKRLTYAEAIELAQGRPTDACRFYRWITGETVSRQAMLEMKKKLTVQCKLTTRAWRSQR